MLCFIAASLSSASGIGGGGLFHVCTHTNYSGGTRAQDNFKAGGSVANILCTMVINCIHGGKSLIDFDIALLS